MANNFLLYVRYFVLAWVVVFLTAGISAAQAPFPTPQMVVNESPLTIRDVIIDKTDKNAVMARNQAIIDAQHRAFEKLMRKSLTEEQFKSYTLPDDKTIASFVENFEIKKEQITTGRYLANFTIRFNQLAADHINSAGGTLRSDDSQTGGTAIVWDRKDASGSAASTVLVLPYIKNSLGKDLLWEDPNPWREAWQKNARTYADLSISVPAGDAVDVAAGSSDAVWGGDYTAIDKLREKYKSEVVVLPVAYRSENYIQVDISLYRNGRLERKKSLPPYNIRSLEGIEDSLLFQKVIPQVVSEIRSISAAALPLEEGLQEIAPALKVVPRGMQPELSLRPQHLVLPSTMTFNNFEQWVEAQKVLSSVSPTLRLDISSLSKDTAWFTITADIPGGFDELRIMLASKGMEITMLPFDQGQPGRALYALRMN